MQTQFCAILFQRALQRAGNHARAADADIDHRFGLVGAVDRAGHKGRVGGLVAKDDKLGRRKSALIRAFFRQVQDHLAQQGHGIHIDALARRADVDRGADFLGA